MQSDNPLIAELEPISDDGKVCRGCYFNERPNSENCYKIPCVPEMKLDGKRLGEYVIWVRKQ